MRIAVKMAFGDSPEYGVWAGAVNAIYGNRATNKFDPKGDERAIDLALNTMLRLHELYPISFGQ
ncbi:MAG: hypothetical protein HY981_01320 [Candidatus Magasanikbacteria bacterium]|nr:hypothetical protein [Candidatus Magasanikbacteria bacterium]